MDTILLIAYVVLSYWAVGQTIYANKIRFGTWSDLFLTRLILGFILGWILIPVAVIKKFFFR
ncbi:MAG: hypothetical protein IJ325_07350 [Clostridia bacterium]|nr:hypothetical protein [Clostridia bacterium]